MTQKGKPESLLGHLGLFESWIYQIPALPVLQPKQKGSWHSTYLEDGGWKRPTKGLFIPALQKQNKQPVKRQFHIWNGAQDVRHLFAINVVIPVLDAPSPPV